MNGYRGYDTHTHIKHTLEYYLALKSKILPFANIWMDLEHFRLSEISQAEKDRYCMISLICGIYKTKQSNKHSKTETES